MICLKPTHIMAISKDFLPFINLNGIISHQPWNPSHVTSAKIPGSSTREIDRYISILSHHRALHVWFAWGWLCMFSHRNGEIFLRAGPWGGCINSNDIMSSLCKQSTHSLMNFHEFNFKSGSQRIAPKQWIYQEIQNGSSLILDSRKASIPRFLWQPKSESDVFEQIQSVRANDELCL